MGGRREPRDEGWWLSRNAALDCAALVPQGSARAAFGKNKSSVWNNVDEMSRKFGMGRHLFVATVVVFVNFYPDKKLVPVNSRLFLGTKNVARAMRNMAHYYGEVLENYKPFYGILTGEPYVDPKALPPVEILRRTAQSGLGYFRIAVYSELAEKGPVDPDELDMRYYEKCGKNPFYLLGVVRGERMRALAGANVLTQFSKAPWNVQAWEGVSADGIGLADRDAVLPLDLEKKYFPNGIYETWPDNPMKGRFEEVEDYEETGAYLTLECPVTSEKVDEDLTALARTSRRLSESTIPW